MFHETLSAALETAFQNIAARHAIIAPADMENNHFTFGGMVYGETKSQSFPLESYKGKATRKYAHVTIWRHETGRYEENTYVL